MATGIKYNFHRIILDIFGPISCRTLLQNGGLSMLYYVANFCKMLRSWDPLLLLVNTHTYGGRLWAVQGYKAAGGSGRLKCYWVKGKGRLYQLDLEVGD
jgi:hypothetical protein